MTERRKSPRTRCRLHCRIRRGRERIRARVLDVSEGGLCVVPPVELKKGQSLQIEIDVPGYGRGNLQADVWHVRRSDSQATRRRAWSAGLIPMESDDAFTRLLAPGEPTFQPGPTASLENNDLGDKPDELKVFRVRVQVKGEPRSRLLTLGATTEKEARELASADLDDSWVITEVRSG